MNVCIITGTRAEYFLLKPIIISLSKIFNIKLVVTGTHLSKMHGYTIQNIQNENIEINHQIDMLLTNDNNISIGKSIGLEIISLSDYFNNHKFDGLILLGDRYEILSAALVATIFRIPIIHFCGGDTTEGAYDDDIRNAISQLSSIHFVSCYESKNKVESFGKSKVYVVGNPGLEYLLDFKADPIKYNNYIMFVYHPETKNLDCMNNDLDEIKKTFDYILSQKINLVVIGSNADNDNHKIKKLYDRFNDKIKYFDSVDRQQYLSLAYHSALFMGNSSSGIYEISYFNKYVINIGDRQKGRRNINNVINVKCEFNKIRDNVNKYFGKSIKSEGGFPVLKTSNLVSDILQKYYKE
jgi:GDP/UDP-N,N'-diacetylbacillosamine 2-epimerase (hydrolysing)